MMQNLCVRILWKDQVLSINTRNVKIQIQRYFVSHPKKNSILYHTKKSPEHATTGVRKFVQIYSIYASASALPACFSQIYTNLWYKHTFPTRKPSNDTHISRLQEPLNQKNKKQTNKKNKIARPMKKKKKKQDCKTHEIRNLGTLGSDILFFSRFSWFSCFFWFSWLSLPGSQVSAQNAQKKHSTPGLSSIWCLMDWAPQQKTVETTIK